MVRQIRDQVKYRLRRSVYVSNEPQVFSEHGASIFGRRSLIHSVYCAFEVLRSSAPSWSHGTPCGLPYPDPQIQHGDALKRTAMGNRCNTRVESSMRECTGRWAKSFCSAGTNPNFPVVEGSVLPAARIEMVRCTVDFTQWRMEGMHP
jgi:hypothetical protein